MNKQRTIYIIDDETTLRDVVRRYLERDDYQVIEASTGPQALELLRAHPADLILLDVMLPGIDGFLLIQRIRALGNDVPIIMLTSRSDESDRITGFELGVDDYVVKPFSPRELVARVRAVLRRAQSNPTERPSEPERPLQFNTLQIDPIKRTVIAHDTAVTLTVKEFDLLWLMARSPQQVFTREQLLNRVWGYEFYGDESTVTVHIRRLREKIEVDPSHPTLIQTVWGVGYKFEPE